MPVSKLSLDSITTEKFLGDVLPAEGTVVVAHLDDTGFHHVTPKSIKDAAEYVREKSFRKNDTYFAMATFRQGPHQAEDGRWRVRYAENVKALKSFWLDIDAGPDKDYATHKEAVAALVDFIRRNAFPTPKYIVNSGGGLHVYWCLPEAIDPVVWQGLAMALKRACIAKGLKADPKCTADSARVLRPIGTRNYKDKPRSVTPLHAVKGFTPLEDFKAAVQPWMDDLEAAPAYIRQQGEGATEELAAGVGGKLQDSFAKNIMRRCGVLHHIEETSGADCSEPMWTATLQLLRFCKDGPEWVHPLSKGHAGYDPKQTDRKFAERLRNNAGPTRCETFAEEYGDICKECPYNEKIKTPLVLGTEGFRDPEQMPSHYRAGKGCTEVFTALKGDEEGEADWQYAFGFAVDSLEYSKLHNQSGAVLRIRAQNPELPNRWPLVDIPYSILFNYAKLSEHLGDYGLPIRHKGEHARFVDLMISWSKQLEQAKRVDYACENLGWQPNRDFALAQETFNARGPTGHGVRPNPAYNDLLRQYVPVGSLEEWKKPMALLCEQQRPDLLSIVAVSFAAPLIRFTGQNGLLLSAVSELSGVGKTSAIYVGQAVWGHPKAISSVDDTQNAVVTRMGLLNSLPAYWDEIRGERSLQNMVNIAFRISEGKDKARLSQAAKMKEVKTWNTMMATASNTSLMDYIEHYDQHTDAGLRRVIEFNIERLVAPEERTDVFYTCMENYGHAGVVYGQWLAANFERVREEYDRLSAAISKATLAEGPERFWIAGITCLLLGAKYANELELAMFPMAAMKDFLLGVLNSLRERVSGAQMARTPCGMLAQYCNSVMKGRLVTDVLGDRHQRNVVVQTAPVMQTAIYQVATKEKSLLVPVGEYKRWLGQMGYSLSLATKLSKLPYVENVKKSVGSYTPFTSAQVVCFKVDISQEPVLGSLAHDVSQRGNVDEV